MADAQEGPGTDLPDTDQLVERALESVLETVPEPRVGVSDDEVKTQPWAEKAAPPGKDKRPLEELLREYATRVAADPEALAETPQGVHPAQAFFERLGRREGGSRQGRGRRWRQRPRRASQQPAPRAERPPAEPGSRPPADRARGNRRRRSRRRR